MKQTHGLSNGVLISVNTLVRRKSDFRVNEWIMDSGAFSQITRSGQFTMSKR
jgi:hypothetical protein